MQVNINTRTRTGNRSLEVVLPLSLDVSLLRNSPPTHLHPTYMYLRIELLCRGGGGVGPGHIVVSGHVEVAVGCVPAVGAGGPRQGGPKRRQQIVQSPGHDGVVVESDVEGDDADGKADPCESGRKLKIFIIKSPFMFI